MNSIKWGLVSRVVLIGLLIIICITYFTRDRLGGVNEIDPALLAEPVQVAIPNPEPIRFTIDKYAYNLTPSHFYEISGLIVSKKDYSWLSIYRRNKALPVDLCMIWGGNVASDSFKNGDVKFWQGMRFCNFQYGPGVAFNQQQLSYNHLLIDNDYVNGIVKDFNVGDQIKITGKLVTVSAINVGEREHDPTYFGMKSSTTRTDTGAGACEVIYVEGVELIKKGNGISAILFKYAIILFILVILANIVNFFRIRR